MNTTIQYNIFEIDCELDVDIYLLNSRIFTTSKLSTFSSSHNKEEGNFLVIGIEQELEHYESLFNVIPYTRPRFLILLGICSFFTKELFTPFDKISSLTKTVEIQEKHECRKFTYYGKDLLPNVKALINFLDNSENNEDRLFFSLIDRWRKALFLETESQDNGIHDDEAVLSYFHILELLSTYYYDEQKSEIKTQIDKFTNDILKNSIFIEESNFKNQFHSKKRLLRETFLSNLSVGSKIFYMLNKQELLTNKLQNFVTTLIKSRNDVAHGRQVYQDKVIFPVPPFFPLIRDRFYSLKDIRTLTGRVISCFIKIEYLTDEWNEIEKLFPPSIEQVKDFLREKQYEHLSNDDYFSGAINDITPDVITNYLFIRKLKPAVVLLAFSDLIKNYEYSDDNVLEILASVIIILDIAEDELKDICTDIIISASSNYSMRDFLNELEYFGFEPELFKAMIIEKQMR